MERSLLIKNGTVVKDNLISKADILVESGIISKVAPSISCEGCEVVDASGLLVLPGLIDAHTHYHLVSRGTVTADSFIEGSRLAAFGGVTTVVDFADHNKNKTLLESTKDRLEEMKPMVIDYSLHQGVYGYNSHIPCEMEELKAFGVKTLKIFTTYRNVGYLIENRDELLDLFKNAKRLGLLVTAHCEFNPLIEEISDNWKGDFSPTSHALLRPSEAESLAIEYFGSIALEANCPLYIVHVSSEKGLQAVLKLRERGATIYSETTPTYLFRDKSFLEGKDGSMYVMTPPLREKSDNKALINGVFNKNIDVVATDHCAFTKEQKLSCSDCRYIYPGVPGTEEMLVLLHTLCVNNNCGFNISDVVRLLGTSPAKLFGLKTKGSLEEGKDGDIVLFDPKIKWILNSYSIHSKSNYTIYDGLEVQGKVVRTYRRGELLVKEGSYYGKEGSGIFLSQE
ncbi:MAG: amidohydrolase family protein [Sphaerochaetaceae bacterium]|nr:amidohydrolase family protein [Sphaerochaetaceae bacterium]